MILRIPLPGLVALVMGGAIAFAGLSGSYVVPVDHDAIRYTTAPTADPIATLPPSIVENLAFDDDFGYLRAVLKALDISPTSQVLVFSKTSFQAPRIAPRTPRALYFNDLVSVGFVRGGDVLEVASLDPKQGVIFYTLDQDPSVKPVFVRRDTCLQCHHSAGTLGVPGLMVRSVYPERSGMPAFQAGTYLNDHRSPLSQRWGGWYVSGTHGSQRHMGNALIADRTRPDQLETENTQNLTDLRWKFDTGAYLTPHSDIVALMTLEHQTHMTNLLTRVGFETRMAMYDQAAVNIAFRQPADMLGESAARRIGNAVEEMVAYMLFADEAKLTEPIRGVSGFAEQFAARGPLREFDLKTRMFRYPLSYMIFSPAFANLPEPARTRTLKRLDEILSGKDTSTAFASLSKADRAAIREAIGGLLTKSAR